jgi:hypothetical protein
MSRDDAPKREYSINPKPEFFAISAPNLRHVCSSWILSSGASQQWCCVECGTSVNDISWLIPEVTDEPR